MLLEQINRKLEELASEVERKKMKRSPPPPYTKKTIGVLVDAETYEALLRLMERENIKSLKEAALVAAKRGLGLAAVMRGLT